MTLIHQSPSSEIYRRESPQGLLYEKHYRRAPNPLDGRRTVQIEFDVLSQLAGIARPPYLGVMRPVSCNVQTDVIVLEAVPGIPTSRLFGPQYRQFKPRTCLAVAWLCGRWLRWFQENLRPETSPDKPKIAAEFADYCRVRIERSNYFQRRSTAFAKSVTDLAEQLIRLAPEDQLRYVWVHGDYAPGNILWDGHRVTAIDFAMIQPGLRLLDPTYFIHRLRTQRLYRPWLRLPIERLTQAFWRGYGESFDGTSPLFVACTLRHYLCRLLTYEQARASSAKDCLHLAWILWSVHQRITRVIRCAEALVATKGLPEEESLRSASVPE